MGGAVRWQVRTLAGSLHSVGGRPVLVDRLGLRVGVDAAELTAKAHVEPGIAAPEVFLGIALEPLLRPTLHWLGDANAPMVGVKDPRRLRHGQSLSIQLEP